MSVSPFPSSTQLKRKGRRAAANQVTSQRRTQAACQTLETADCPRSFVAAWPPGPSLPQSRAVNTCGITKSRETQPTLNHTALQPPWPSTLTGCQAVWPRLRDPGKAKGLGP